MNIFPFSIRRKYAHLSPDDTKIWSSFIAHESDFFDTVAYDVGVGHGIRIDPLWPDYVQTSAKRLTQKRIDVLAFKKSLPWIVEIKPILDLTAPGQAAGYKILYDLEHTSNPAVGALIICQIVAPDCLEICKAFGVKHYQLPSPVLF